MHHDTYIHTYMHPSISVYRVQFSFTVCSPLMHAAGVVEQCQREVRAREASVGELQGEMVVLRTCGRCLPH